MSRKYLSTNEKWTEQELKIFQNLDSPFAIQEYLNSIPYSADPFYRSPRSVLRDARAHCFDGALFAACTLSQIGFPPLIIDMLAERDDDHLLAIYKVKGYFGAVAKSNFVGLRFREPVYKTLRELVMSYFESYYNVAAEKTLRGYTTTLNLSRFDHLDWMTSDDELEVVADALDQVRRFTIGPNANFNKLNPVDKRSYDAGLLGVNEAGLYRPGQH